MRVQILDSNFYFGDEPEGFIYPGEKNDKRKLEAIYDQMRAIYDDAMPGDRDEYPRDVMHYLSTDDFDDLENLQWKADCISRMRHEAKGILDEWALYDTEPFENEPLSEREREDVVWDMSAAQMEADYCPPKYSAIHRCYDLACRYHPLNGNGNWGNHKSGPKAKRESKARRQARRLKNGEQLAA